MLEFGRLTDLINNGRALDINQALFLVFKNPDYQDLIIHLNTQGQLFDKGIDSKGKDLSSIGGSYAPVTVEIKKFTGLPYNRVTLYQEGDFYRSFSVEAQKDALIIDANTIKDGDDLRDRWGEDIIGLTDESIEELINEIIPEIIEIIKEQLLR